MPHESRVSTRVPGVQYDEGLKRLEETPRRITPEINRLLGGSQRMVRVEVDKSGVSKK